MAEQSKKKVAVVTGASRGIGRAIALELASRGAAVVINYNGSEERAREVQKEIEEKGGEAEIRQWNVADYKACEGAVKDIVKLMEALIFWLIMPESQRRTSDGNVRRRF